MRELNMCFQEDAPVPQAALVHKHLSAECWIVSLKTEVTFLQLWPSFLVQGLVGHI